MCIALIFRYHQILIFTAQQTHDRLKETHPNIHGLPKLPIESKASILLLLKVSNISVSWSIGAQDQCDTDSLWDNSGG